MRHLSLAVALGCCFGGAFGCGSNGGSSNVTQSAADASAADASQGDGGEPASSSFANVSAVEASGQPGAYTFNVTIASPDSGCSRYADWWEALDENGALLYRRILAHSHVDEQPFSRSGGPVSASADQTVIVRAHMNPEGYGGQALQGSVAAGFSPTELEEGFASGVEREAPLPDGCAF